MRHALVTGGGSGIGRAICHALAADGVHVAVTDIDIDAAKACQAELAAEGWQASAHQLDVTDSAAVIKTINALVKTQGLDTLVNCAGWDQHKPFHHTDESFWDRIIDLNFKGTLRTTHALLPHLVERGGGRIINIASDAGRIGATLEAVYSGAKGGVIAFTKAIAREYARHGITANAVCPGPTQTPLLDQILAANSNGERAIGGMIRATPMKRLGTGADVAGAVVYFASDAAGFVTGQTLSVSGGITMC